MILMMIVVVVTMIVMVVTMVVVMVPPAVIVVAPHDASGHVRQKKDQAQQKNGDLHGHSHDNSPNKNLNQKATGPESATPPNAYPGRLLFRFSETLFLQPANGLRTIRAYKENLLHGAGSDI